MLEFALPILYANVLQSLNLSVNSMWVGHYLGEAALAATSNVNNLVFVLLGAVYGLALAATILVGRCIGSNDVHQAKRIVGTSVTFFAAIAVGVAFTGVFSAEALLALMNTPAESLSLAVSYLRVMLVALPFQYMLAFVMSVLRGAGDSKTPLHFMLLSVVIDIALNPLFIFGAGPIAALGVEGSAFATFAAQAVGLVALVSYLYRRGHMLCLRKDELWMLRVRWAIVGTLLRRGIPMSGHMLVVTLNGLLMITLVNHFGAETTAAFGASIQLWNYIQMPAFAVGFAVSSMAAQNVGAQRWDRVNSIAQVGVEFGVLLTACVALSIEVLDTRAVEWFVPAGSAAVQIAGHIGRVATWSFVFLGVSAALFGVVRATGAVTPPLLILTCVLIVRFWTTHALIDRWHAEAIWWSFPISSALTALLATLYYRYGGWRTHRI
jgi:putative MATE family efflux protein